MPGSPHPRSGRQPGGPKAVDRRDAPRYGIADQESLIASVGSTNITKKWRNTFRPKYL
jgi:hypothetical protein